ncbi:MAG: hypothetical protein IPM53_02030 [Anaerolineaceae bacterium]|nr:hypothetical protein [Anaerolineaceae bacterium]
MEKTIYTAFGLTWHLPFVCPEMGAPTTAVTANVSVSLGQVPDILPQATDAGPFQQVTPEAVLFRFPGVASYLVQNGAEIIIQPEPGAPETQLRLFLLGTAAALLLHQRGILPLHASGIRTPQGAVLFTGHSGFGKSTLLATFLERGYAMLTDDVAAISLDGNGRPHVSPSYPHFKLWADSAEMLNRTTDSLARVHPELEKFAVPAVALDNCSLPLHTVYVLTPSNEPSLRLEPLHNARKFNVFLDHTWQKMALKRMNRHAEHFRQSVAVANQIRLHRVYRPEKPFQPYALADLIEADFLS